eukprot:8803238-Lingulodinium_polyedra.AAC.1
MPPRPGIRPAQRRFLCGSGPHGLGVVPPLPGGNQSACWHCDGLVIAGAPSFEPAIVAQIDLFFELRARDGARGGSATAQSHP